MLKVFFKKGEICVKETDTPKLNFDDFENVILRVIYSGFCGSDIHRIDDFSDFKNTIPTLGHEIVGEVIYSNNSKFSSGCLAVLMPIGSCGKCKYCKIGKIVL